MKIILAAALLALPLAACNQTAGGPPPVEAAAAPRPSSPGSAAPLARMTPRERAAYARASAEQTRMQACAEATQQAANTAVGTAILGGALDVAGAGMWGRAGWVTSAAGSAIADTGAVMAEQRMNQAVARGEC